MGAADLLAWPGGLLDRLRAKPLEPGEMIEQLSIAASIGSTRAHRRLGEIVDDHDAPLLTRQRARIAWFRCCIRYGHPDNRERTPKCP